MTSPRKPVTTPPAAPAPASGGYAFSNRASRAAQQLAALATYLDPITLQVLSDIRVPAAGRCLELGPGGGSIAHWLCRQVGPSGTVVAVDQDPSLLAPARNLEVHVHDLSTGLPRTVAGPFDLIHARLVLVHLPNRRQLAAELAAALAPGGWLVLGEFSGHPLRVITSRTGTDAALFTKVIEAFTELLVTRHGADTGWAHQVHPVLADLGLQDLKTIEYAESWTGGEPGCRLHDANISQLHDRLLDAGLSPAELTRFGHLLTDPRFSARSWQFVCTRGRRSLATPPTPDRFRR